MCLMLKLTPIYILFLPLERKSLFGLLEVRRTKLFLAFHLMENGLPTSAGSASLVVHADGSQGHLLVEDDFGGNVHDRVLQALTKPVYAKWRIRSLSETPQSTFGFTTKPVILVVNEVTLSDGEMTANGFKTLKRGPVIGNTTYGWLIFTTSVSLMNGGYFRLPFWGCYTLDGKDLGTSSGVKPDVMVVNDLNHELQNQDPQLQKAIELALKAIKK